LFKNIWQKIKEREDNVSLGLGVVMTVMIAGLFFAYFKSVNFGTRGQISETGSKTEYKQMQVLAAANENNLPAEYVVQKGDSLWKVAATVYGDGFQWGKIYDQNKAVMANPNLLKIGTKIVIPKLLNQDQTKSYTVVKGDNLWKIGMNQCGSGFAWTSITTQNHLANPRIIHPGNVLKFRCQ